MCVDSTKSLRDAKASVIWVVSVHYVKTKPSCFRINGITQPLTKSEKGFVFSQKNEVKLPPEDVTVSTAVPLNSLNASR